MPAISLVKQAHELIRQRLKPGNIAIDATVGNGHDTLFLLDLVNPTGKVFGFDIQPSAIAATRALINANSNPECLTLLSADHAEMGKYIPIAYHGNINAVMFNLGYLPGGDKQIITRTASTITALTSTCNLLAPRGTLTILAYPGHQGGQMEAEQVKRWCANLNTDHYHWRIFTSNSDKPSAPVLYVVEKVIKGMVL